MDNVRKENVFTICKELKKSFETITSFPKGDNINQSAKFIFNKLDGERITYPVYNLYLNEIFVVASNVSANENRTIKVRPYDKRLQNNEDHKRKALDSLFSIFARGHNLGEQYFNTELKPVYNQLFISDFDRFIKTLITDYENGAYNADISESTKQYTFKRYKQLIPICFNEQSIYNYGYVNGVYNGFKRYLKSKPSIKAELLKANEVDDNPKTKVKKPTFEDFFTGIEKKQIEQIKENFRDLEPKETAILIDLLFNDFKVLNLVHGSKQGKSQKDFIKYVTNNSNQSINFLFSKNPLENYVYTGNQADKTLIKNRLQSILK